MVYWNRVFYLGRQRIMEDLKPGNKERASLTLSKKFSWILIRTKLWFAWTKLPWWTNLTLAPKISPKVKFLECNHKIYLQNNTFIANIRWWRQFCQGLSFRIQYNPIISRTMLLCRAGVTVLIFRRYSLSPTGCPTKRQKSLNPSASSGSL